MGIRRRAWTAAISLVVAGVTGPAIAAPQVVTAAAAAPATTVGAIAGQPGVGDSGEATYSIPIALPPGAAGFTPDLALEYSSQAADGLAGVGWIVRGLSSIARCPASAALDGFTGGIDFDASDRFCLDGQRLIAVSGAYGANNTEYRLEREPRVKIVSAGTAGSGPSFFVVHYPDGRAAVYGLTTDSTAVGLALGGARAGSVRAWAESRLVDTAGNVVSFAYTQDATNGDYRPASITYAGNTVTFGYESRPAGDAATFAQYPGGAKVASAMRLNDISTATGGALVNDYRLAYEPSLSPRGRSRLSSVTECDGGGICKPPTTLTWANGTPGIDSPIAGLSSLTKVMSNAGDLRGWDLFPGDFNGDGFTDLYLNGGASGARFCAGPGISQASANAMNDCVATPAGGFPSSTWTLYPGDYEGNGHAGFYAVSTSGTEYCAGAKVLASPMCVKNNGSDWRTGLTALAGDFDGDGRTDLYFVATTGTWFCSGATLTVLNGMSCVKNNGNDWRTGLTAYAGDFNGDGRTDVLFVGASGSWVCPGGSLTGANTMSCTKVTSGNWTGFTVRVGDFNGDGNGDVFLIGDAASYFCPGPGIMAANDCQAIPNSANWKTGYVWFTGDFNGDGVIDLARAKGDHSRLDFCAGPGITTSDTGCITITTNSTDLQGIQSVTPGDFNGDGTPDFLVTAVATRPVQVQVCPATALVSFSHDYTQGPFTYTTTTVPGITVNQTSATPGANGQCLMTGTEAAASLPVNASTESFTFGTFPTCPSPFAGSVPLTSADDLHGHNWTNIRFSGSAPLHNVDTLNVCHYVMSIPAGQLNAPAQTDSTMVPSQAATQLVFDHNVVYFGQGRAGVEDVLTGLTNGLGDVTQWDYKPLTDTSVYTKGAEPAYPDRAESGPIYVVSQMRRTDGTGGPGDTSHMSSTTYAYAGLSTDLSRRQSLGFRIITSVDSATGLQTVRRLRNDYPFEGREAVRQIRTQSGAGKLIEQVVTGWDQLLATAGCAACSIVFAKHTVDAQFELDGNSGPVKIVDQSNPDAYGNFGTVTTTLDNTLTGNATEYVQTTSSNFLNDLTAWRLGRPTAVVESASGPGPTTGPRITSYTYDNADPTHHPNPNGLLRQVIENGLGPASLTTTFDLDRDSFGNVTTETVSGGGIPRPRATTTTYDSNGRFPTQTQNALLQVTKLGFDPRFGLMTSRTDPNGVAASWTFDGFGRPSTENLGDGRTTTWTYRARFTANAAMAMGIGVNTSDAGRTLEDVDIKGRVATTVRPGLGGNVIETDRTFDPVGRVSHETRPRYIADAREDTVYQYDELDRVTSVTNPDGSQWINKYYARVIKSTTSPPPVPGAAGETSAEVKDSAGSVTYASDGAGSSVTATYDGFGDRTSLSDTAGNKTTMTYDIAGHLSDVQDPDRGHLTYSYNGLGELLQSTTPISTVAQTFDDTGRIASRSDTAALSTSWTWGYDSGANAIGRLTSVTGSDGTVLSYGYNALGQLTTETTTAGGLTFTAETTYDSAGRVDLYKYPADPSHVSTRFITQSSYYPGSGELQSIARVDPSGANPTTLWTATNADALGRVQQETYGNGVQSTRTFDPVTARLQAISTGASGAVQNLHYTWDTLGNLLSRADVNKDLTETFQYDAANRLIESTVAQSFYDSYDATGNLTCKDSTLANDTSCAQGTRIGYGTFTAPGATSPTVAGPHFASTVTTAGATTYNYPDAAGDQARSQSPSQVRALTYFSYGQPRILHDGGTAESRTYGPDGQLLVKTVYPSHTETMRIGDRYERTTVNGGTASHRDYVYAGDRIVAVHNQVGEAAWDPSQVSYLHDDHLGTVDTITNSAGATVQSNSFAAFGSRRDPVTLAPAAAPAGSPTDRGYTSQPEEAAFGLDDYGARLYDPAIGRFLQPDPLVQDPMTPQRANPYSYAGNNPLDRTDPSGKGWVTVDYTVPDAEFSGWYQSAWTTANDWAQTGLTNVAISVQQGIGCGEESDTPCYDDITIRGYSSASNDAIANSASDASKPVETSGSSSLVSVDTQQAVQNIQAYFSAFPAAEQFTAAHSLASLGPDMGQLLRQVNVAVPLATLGITSSFEPDAAVSLAYPLARDVLHAVSSGQCAGVCESDLVQAQVMNQAATKEAGEGLRWWLKQSMLVVIKKAFVVGDLEPGLIDDAVRTYDCASAQTLNACLHAAIQISRHAEIGGDKYKEVREIGRTAGDRAVDSAFPAPQPLPNGPPDRILNGNF